MPKMKTRRMARKKFRIAASGRLKRAQAGASHNTGKKSSSSVRKLRHSKGIDDTNMYQISKSMPYAIGKTK